MNNHWLVNFQAGQDGVIPLRYRLTTHDGPVDTTAAAHFAAEATVPPVVLRDRAAAGPKTDQFFKLDPRSPVLVTAKPSENEGWVALRIQNLSGEAARPSISFAQPPKAARGADPIEHPGDAIALNGKELAVDLAPLEIATVLVGFG
jgi:hypothetical protein